MINTLPQRKITKLNKRVEWRRSVISLRRKSLVSFPRDHALMRIISACCEENPPPIVELITRTAASTSCGGTTAGILRNPFWIKSFFPPRTAETNHYHTWNRGNTSAGRKSIPKGTNGSVSFTNFCFGAAAVSLLHKHFDLNENELLLEKFEAHSSKITPSSTHGANAIPYIWKIESYVAGPSFRPLEFLNKNDVTLTQYENLTGNQIFLEEFSKMLLAFKVGTWCAV